MVLAVFYLVWKAPMIDLIEMEIFCVRVTFNFMNKFMYFSVLILFPQITTTISVKLLSEKERKMQSNILTLSWDINKECF